MAGTIRMSFVLMENKKSDHEPINLTLKILTSIHYALIPNLEIKPRNTKK